MPKEQFREADVIKKMFVTTHSIQNFCLLLMYFSLFSFADKITRAVWYQQPRRDSAGGTHSHRIKKFI